MHLYILPSCFVTIPPHKVHYGMGYQMYLASILLTPPTVSTVMCVIMALEIDTFDRHPCMIVAYNKIP